MNTSLVLDFIAGTFAFSAWLISHVKDWTGKIWSAFAFLYSLFPSADIVLTWFVLAMFFLGFLACVVYIGYAVCQLFVYTRGGFVDAFYLLWTPVVRLYRRRWPKTTFVDLPASAEKIVHDLRGLDAKVEIVNGSPVMVFQTETSLYYVPQYKYDVPAAVPQVQQAKEQATSSLVFPLAEGKIKSAAPGLITFYQKAGSAGSELIGQGVLAKLPDGSLRVLTTRHEWNTLESILALKTTTLQLVGAQMSKAVEITKDQVALVSSAGDGDERGFDMVTLSLPERVYSCAGVRAARLARSPGLSMPNLIWRTSLGDVRIATASVFRREKIGIRAHNASTQPGTSGAPIYTQQGALVGLHIGTHLGTPLNLAIDLTIMFPQRGVKESDHYSNDDQAVDLDADPKRVKKIFSDATSSQFYYEDYAGKIGYTSSGNWQWDEVADPEDDQNLYWYDDLVKSRNRRENIDRIVSENLDDTEGSNRSNRRDFLPESGKITNPKTVKPVHTLDSSVAAPASNLATSSSETAKPAHASDSSVAVPAGLFSKEVLQQLAQQLISMMPTVASPVQAAVEAAAIPSPQTPTPPRVWTRTDKEGIAIQQQIEFALTHKNLELVAMLEKQYASFRKKTRARKPRKDSQLTVKVNAKVPVPVQSSPAPPAVTPVAAPNKPAQDFQ